MADLVPSFTFADLQNLRASQYVSAVGLVVLLWDHFLTLHDEIELIWRARLSFPKVLFLFNRYAVPTCLIVLTYATSGFSDDILSHSFCQAWFGVGIVIGMVSIGTSNFLILLRLWVLWDRRTRLVVITLSLFLITQITAIVCTTYVVLSMMREWSYIGYRDVYLFGVAFMIFEPYMHSCMLTQKVNFVVLWAPGIVFEVMIFITTWWNALDKPLAQHTKMTKVMYRDGSIYFFVLFGLRLSNLILSIVSPLSLIFLGVFFIWSACNVTLSRLVINLRRAAIEAEEDNLQLADAQGSWPFSSRQGSCVSENYELQSQGPDTDICTSFSPSVTSITM